MGRLVERRSRMYIDIPRSMYDARLTRSMKVSLVKLSMKQKDALNVLLTGRSENDFADLIRKIVNSKGLEFDMVCLKPEAGPSNQRFASETLCLQPSQVPRSSHFGEQ